MYSLEVSLALLHLFGTTAAQVSSPIVKTSAGTIQGGKCNNTDAISYLAIPYAQPPIEDLRFESPKPYTGKYPGGHFNATVQAPNCIQFEVEFADPGPSSEDCLYLDIYVPPNTSNTSLLPVKVWVYGGGEMGGGVANALYTGCNLATDAIVVTVNYRVGPLGFLALSSAGIEGNFGIQDIILALQWVQSNIVTFGGDKTKVLVFGQSAGAVNTFFISTLAEAPSLMNAAIMESGGGRDAPINSSFQATGTKYAQRLNCSVTDVSCLRSKSPFELNATLTGGGSGFSGVFDTSFEPYVDGKFIPIQPSQAGVKVPAIFGSNAMEATFSLLFDYRSTTAPQEANYTALLQSGFGSLASTVEEKYPISAYNSTEFPIFYAMTAIITDFSYKCPAYRGLEMALKNNVPAYTYLWSHTPSCPWFKSIPIEGLPYFGATHTSEVPFVLGDVYDLPLPPNGTCNFTSAEKDLSSFFIKAWTSMAENGNPGSTWPAFGNSSMGMNFVNTTSVGVVDYSPCAFWDKINAQLLADATGGASTVPQSGGNATTTTTGSSTAASSGSTPTSSNSAAKLSRKIGAQWIGLLTAIGVGALL